MPLLTDELPALARQAGALGSDSLAFLPDPHAIPQPETLLRAIDHAGSSIGVVV